jgi:hypothetical protein
LYSFYASAFSSTKLEIRAEQFLGLGIWLRRYSTCSAYVRPWVQSPLLKKNE